MTETQTVAELRSALRDLVKTNTITIGKLPTALSVGRWIALANQVKLNNAIAGLQIEGEPYRGFDDDAVPLETGDSGTNGAKDEIPLPPSPLGQGQDGSPAGEGAEPAEPIKLEPLPSDGDGKTAAEKALEDSKEQAKSQAQGSPPDDAFLALWDKCAVASDKVTSPEDVLALGEAIINHVGNVADTMARNIEAVAQQAAIAATMSGGGPAGPAIIEIKQPDGSMTKIKGLTHYLFPLVLRVISSGVHVWLVGPAGGGKTYLAGQVATAFFGDGDKFYPKSCGPEMSEFDLLGYRDGNKGNYVPGLLRQPYEHGGLLALDEIDRGSPAVLTTLNSALANSHCSFPDGVVKVSDKFRAVAMGNTWGLGSDSQYVGAARIDAATLDRFAFLPMEYDHKLEAKLIGAQAPKFTRQVKFTLSNTPTCTAQKWSDKVFALRKAAKKVGTRIIISPRATINGYKLTQAGIDVKTVLAMTIWRGTDKSTVSKIQEAAGI